MKYQAPFQRKSMRVGDKVTYSGVPGYIVFIINDDAYSEGYRKEHWSYLGKGFGVEFQDGEDLEPYFEEEKRSADTHAGRSPQPKAPATQPSRGVKSTGDEDTADKGQGAAKKRRRG